MPFNDSYLQTNITEIIKTDIAYVAFCSDFDNPGRSPNIATALELGRVPASVSRSGNVITITATLGSSVANCKSSLITNTPSDKKTFDIVDATGFNVGDMIEIYSTAGGIEEQRKIANISTNTITLDRELVNLPVNNEVFKQMIANFQLIDGGSLTANTGTSIFSMQYKYFKTSTIEKAFSWSINVSDLVV